MNFDKLETLLETIDPKVNTQHVPLNQRHPDLDAADANWIEFVKPGHYDNHHGSKANELMDCPHFDCTPFPYSVWELTGTSVVTEKPVAILRANQTTLEGSLKYMTVDRILVYNRQADCVASAVALLAERDALKARCAELERAMANACQNTVNGNGRIQRLETALEACCQQWPFVEGESVSPALQAARAALAGKGDK